MPIRAILLVACMTFFGRSAANAAPSIAEPLAADVYLVRDDAGAWGGVGTGMTHQRGPDYWAKKVLDLSHVPEAFWKEATEARLSVYFTVRDYSSHDARQTNGLDETFQIVVNGKPHQVPTNSGVPVFSEHESPERCFRWHDFALAKEELVRGPNEIIFRMVSPPGKAPDDYLYLGIDNTVPGGNSWVRFGKGGPWQQDQITVPVGGKGEYMVRLYVLCGPRRFVAAWRPGQQRGDDPAGILDYAGSHGEATRVEWDPQRLDPLAPLTVRVETADAAPFDLFWLDARGKPVSPPSKARGPRHEETLRPAPGMMPSGVQLAKGVSLKSVSLAAAKNYHPTARQIDMAPRLQPPKGAPVSRAPSCRIEGDRVRLANGNLRCEFSRAGGKLRLLSLVNEIAAAEMVRRPEDSALAMVEVAGKRYAASRDFQCRSIAAIPAEAGFRAALFCQPIGLEASLSVRIDDDLRLGLDVTNRGGKALDFKLAFPHLSGLAISDHPSDDYYFFPWGGGIVAAAPAVIRRGYGDHEAIYQVMDLFSPSRGGGLAVRCSDADGRHKVLALRKHVPGQAEINGDAANTPTADEYKWSNSLPAVAGVGCTYEYLRRTRAPGESFSAKEVSLRAHAGDWHEAMRDYAAWCRRVWKFRPYPSRLTPVVSMLAAGWGQDVLFRDGKYRADLVPSRCDCVELMSWWEWSPLGPWGTPLDQIEKKLGAGKYKEWQAYFAKDPVTGRLMFNNNPGDYDGYNARWGGLPALREAIRSCRKAGALVTLYTDPLRVDGNSRCGQQWGKLWGVVQPDGKYRDDYDAWRMCHDVAEYRKFTADAMRRVLRETDADGIRLDEYGHCGSACFSKLHQHTFAEWGNTEWQRCIAETTRLVRQAMDEAKPGSVLTTEHPGCDYLMPFIEGCITYDLSVQATPLRALECNLQRFYFPECKAYELVYDPQRTDGDHHKRFWNAVGAFGSCYPPDMDAVLRENEDAFSSRDNEPLTPTLTRFVYANRFRAGPKTLYTLYNAAGHTVAGPVLKLDLQPGEHVVDLLRCREAETRPGSDGTTIHLFLPRDDVACLARLPLRLAVRRAGKVLEATLGKVEAGWQVRVCDAQGQALASVRAAAGTTTLNLADPGAKGPQAVCIKLMDGARLIDVVPVPSQ